MAWISVLWALFGYSLCFAPGNPFIGGLDYVLLHNVGGAPNPAYAATIPQQTFMVFQLMFAIITPGLIAGAFAERMKFSAMLIFTTLWFLFVYAPLAHMVWGQGGFLNASRRRAFSHSGFCRRHRGAHQFGSFGAGLRALPRQAHRIPARADAAA